MHGRVEGETMGKAARGKRKEEKEMQETRVLHLAGPFVLLCRLPNKLGSKKTKEREREETIKKQCVCGVKEISW